MRRDFRALIYPQVFKKVGIIKLSICLMMSMMAMFFTVFLLGSHIYYMINNTSYLKNRFQKVILISLIRCQFFRNKASTIGKDSSFGTADAGLVTRKWNSLLIKDTIISLAPIVCSRSFGLTLNQNQKSQKKQKIKFSFYLYCVDGYFFLFVKPVFWIFYKS